MQQPTPLESFMRFVIGFTVFIGISVGATFLATQYSVKTADTAHLQAAAFQALIAK